MRFTHPTGWVGVCDMKTIIVTGGAGFIGSCFIRQCIFVGDDGVALVLGDNIFYGDGFQAGLDRAVRGFENDYGAYLLNLAPDA